MLIFQRRAHVLAAVVTDKVADQHAGNLNQQQYKFLIMNSPDQD